MGRCDKRIIMPFLRYVCGNYDVAKSEALCKCSRQFEMLYDRINGSKLDSNDARDPVPVRFLTQEIRR